MPETTLPKTYDFRATEQKLYQWWEAHGWFAPWNDPNKPNFDPTTKPFVISIPPPNVTGELHLGHAMFVAVEDMMIRYHRMRGEPTLWVPGSDHAGIATQLQVEKELLRTEEVTREELGREKFLEKTWEWKHKYGSIIYDQLRRLGASCDWSRERFTLDEGLSRAVREAFVRLYEKGLIYRGPRLINWSPGLKTAVSDLEVEYLEEPGTLYYFKYRIKGSDDFIPVATTRPETILGDTAVAVHPEDARYQKFIGQTTLVPILQREIPVIADEAVDREFGGGALKITPGHDPTDYEIGARHGLPIISVLDREAKVTEAGGPYKGMDRFEARKKLWADMERAGLTIKTEPYMLNVPRSQRGGEIVEPMISTQWFVKIKPLAEAALAAVKDGRIRIVPERFEKVYFNWLENIKDWCISRQLWWGHRIPIWYCPNGHMTTGRADPARCATCGSDQLEQDPDVLDTWFSSGLWPFSTLGWPDETPDYKYFYPTSVLETGYDILFFWVARMIMFGEEFTGQPPFHTVYLHGIIRDEQGRKMSKTLGNVVDPREVMDDYGTDALRFTLLTAGSPGNDLNLSLQRVEANRNFANKIWNIARFVLGNLTTDDPSTALRTGRRPLTAVGRQPSAVSLADRWILSRLNQTIADCTRLIDRYEFGQAGTLAQEFLWGDFADWYVEYAKAPLSEQDENAKTRTREILVYVLDMALRLLHPYVPYVTEAIWQHLPHLPDDPPALIIARWPEAGSVDETALADFGHLQEIIRAIRNARAEIGARSKTVPLQNKSIPATLVTGDAARTQWLREQRPTLISLARLEDTQFRIFAELPEKPQNAIALVIGATEVYLPLAGLVDLGAERERLTKELAELDRQIQKSENLLASDFASKAPTAVVERERAKLASLKESRGKVKEQLDKIK
jgi:valyl-tRNA synthetase